MTRARFSSIGMQAGMSCVQVDIQDGVKNGFSDLTKVQEGQDHQGKALREGCLERR